MPSSTATRPTPPPAGEVDEAFGQLSGPATKVVLRRMYEHYGDVRFTRLAHISNGHLWMPPVMQGLFYVVAVMDWATRHVLAWRLSNTMDTSFCVGALDDALAGRRRRS